MATPDSPATTQEDVKDIPEQKDRAAADALRPSAEASSAEASPSPFFSPIQWLKTRFFGVEQDIRQSLGDIVSAEVLTNSATNLSEDERTMIRNILHYHEVRVDDVMVPRADIIAFDDAEGFESLVAVFLDAQHSRIPVYSDNLDHVTGMVHIKDIVRPLSPKANGQVRKRPSVASLLRSVLYVPPSMRVIDLLARMRAARVHMAVVVDEFGGTDGLVTIEDLVEQIVGDIEDEHDLAEPDSVQEIAENVWLADARLSVEKLEETINVPLRALDKEIDVDTLGGLVVYLAGSVPPIGEQVKHASGFCLEIIDGDPRRIKQVRITKTDAAETAAETKD